MCECIMKNRMQKYRSRRKKGKEEQTKKNAEEIEEEGFGCA